MMMRSRSKGGEGDDVRISICMLTHNEYESMSFLLDYLSDHSTSFDQFVILDDQSDDRFHSLLRRYQRALNIQIHSHPLGADFARQRNLAKSLCDGEVLFWFDPDELPSERLMLDLRKIASVVTTEGYDAARVRRANFLKSGDKSDTFGFHPKHLLNLITPVDVDIGYRFSIINNSPDIKWKYRVHERIMGIRKGITLNEEDGYFILHYKSISKQQRSAKYYKTMAGARLTKLRKIIDKRISRPPETIWSDFSLDA